MYHPITSASMDEAAALLAALSRFLDSPNGMSFGEGGRLLESYVVNATDVDDGAIVYLSDEAMRAMREGFGAPATTSGNAVPDVPATAIRVSLADPRAARGKDDILLELASR